MNSEQLKIFLKVAREGSFSRAENDLYISKQAMFKQINRLEEELGCTLFERTRTGVKLTEEGLIFQDGAEDILELEDELKRRCRRKTPDSIRVGAVEHQVILDPVNDAFSKKYPDIRIEKIVHPNHSGEFRVSEGIMDVGETFDDGRHSFANLCYTKLTESAYTAAVNRKHSLHSRRMVSLRDLSMYRTFVFPMMIRDEYMETVRNAFRDHRENLIERTDVDNQVSCAFECVNEGYVLITANPFIRSVKELRCIPLEEGWTREYGIIYTEPVSETVKLYIDTALEIYGRNKRNRKQVF